MKLYIGTYEHRSKWRNKQNVEDSGGEMGTGSQQESGKYRMREYLLVGGSRPWFKNLSFLLSTKAKKKSETWVLQPMFLPRFMSIAWHLVLVV